MLYSLAIAFLAPILAASAVNITVKVGDANGLTYTPSSVTAQAGDNVVFEFLSKNHTVTQSTFAAPCTLMTTPKQGIDSGFQFVEPNATAFPSWSFTVDDPSTPLWFYCRQKTPVSHCVSGMVFAVNPTANKTFDMFQAAAKASNGTAPGSSGSAPAPGSSTTGSSTASGPGAGQTTTPDNGALRMSSGAAGILTVIGLAAGLLL